MLDIVKRSRSVFLIGCEGISSSFSYERLGVLVSWYVLNILCSITVLCRSSVYIHGMTI